MFAMNWDSQVVWKKTSRFYPRNTPKSDSPYPLGVRLAEEAGGEPAGLIRHVRKVTPWVPSVDFPTVQMIACRSLTLRADSESAALQAHISL
jgi:hypothetical protein